MRIFDADIAYGRGALALPRELETVADLREEMAFAGIGAALVWHRDAWERDFAQGNARLVAEIAGQENLHPVWTVVPPCCAEIETVPELIARMRTVGARAARIFPTRHCFNLDPVSCGPLFEAFIAHRIPLFVPLPEMPGLWQGVYDCLRAFPELRLVLTQTGCWGEDRRFRPLMQRYPGFHITMDRLETAGQLAELVDVCGSRQILFASGLPRNCPGGPILSLLRAGLAEADREAIAHGNIEGLLEEVPW